MAKGMREIGALILSLIPYHTPANAQMPNYREWSAPEVRLFKGGSQITYREGRDMSSSVVREFHTNGSTYFVVGYGAQSNETPGKRPLEVYVVPEQGKVIEDKRLAEQISRENCGRCHPVTNKQTRL